MPLARPCSSKPSARQTRHFLRTFLPRKFMVVHSSDGGGLVGVGVPNENRFRSCGASFNPARALLHVPFYWKGDLVPRSRRERSHQPAEAGTSTAGITLGRPRHSLSGGVGGTPDLRRFRINRRVSVPITCFHVASVHIERGIRVPNSVASRLFGQQGSVQQLPTPPAVALVAMHPRRTHGWDAESTSFGSFSFQSQSHAATTARIGADTPHSCSRREGTIDPRLQLHRVIDVALSGNQASTGMLAKKDSERICRLIPDRRFCPLSHFRVTTFISRGGPSTYHAFRHGHRVHNGF